MEMVRKCTCGNHKLSIRGKCHVCGGKSDKPYNGGPKQIQLPTTARGLRRHS